MDMINWQRLLAQRTVGMRASEIRDAFQLADLPEGSRLPNRSRLRN